jgi:alpha-L-fucosidase
MTHEQISKFMPEMKKHPQLIYNDRLGGDFKGDLETPEQYIPATGIPGKNWEVCMTMNESWGFKKNDNDWKSTKSLVHNLIDIASKGGNFLLNVGPDQMGIIPQASVERLKEIGSWMDIYGEAIYGTTASPFEKIEWGRCTKKVSKQKTTLYFHIFDFPENKKLILTGLEANILKAYPLASKKQKLKIEKQGNCPVIDLSNVEPNQWATVIAVEVPNEISVYHAPAIETNFSVFLDTIIFSTSCNIENAIIRYTTDGSIPDANSPTSVEKNILNPTSDFVLKAACFNGSNIASYVSEMEFKKTAVVAASKVNITKPGIRYNYYKKNWEALPDYSTETPVESGICDSPNTNIRKRDFSFGFLFNGYIDIPKTGIYQFRLTSDDGSLLSLSGNTIMNDGIHGMETKILDIALEKGLHPIEIQYFQQGGGHGFDFSWKSGDEEALPVDKIYWKH